MSKSSDPGHFFQTTTALEESARKSAKSKNTKGDPIKLTSKILALAKDPRDEKSVFAVEAAGTVKCVDVDSKQTTATYTGPTAPLTSLAISPSSNRLFAGCWDKTIWTWDLKTRKPGPRLQAHADFVKCLLLVRAGGSELLLSGSADATIIVWDIASGRKLHTLKGHARAVLALALDPESCDELGTQESVVVFSAGSDRTIRRWRVCPTQAAEIAEDGTSAGVPVPIIAHETSIDALHFDADGDLWTASADKTAKCLSRSRNWAAELTLEHPDFVRDVLVDEVGGWVITACRDEEVRVWDRGTGSLKFAFEGHWEEVLGLVGVGRRVVSAGIDGTVRVWDVSGAGLERAIREREEERGGVEKVEERKEGLMTEEEERELAELMGSDSE